MKFIVKILEVQDDTATETRELAMEAPTHTWAILKAMEEAGDDETQPTKAHTVAYIAERVQRRPDDEPEQIFFMRLHADKPWTVIDGEEHREATQEEAELLAEAGKEVGAFGLKNDKYVEIEKPRRPHSKKRGPTGVPDARKGTPSRSNSHQ